MKTKEEILAIIQNIFRETLENENLEINELSSAENVEGWDSINNLILISSIEEKLDVNFPIEVIFNAKNLGDLVNFIMESKQR